MPTASPSAPKSEKQRVMKERMDAWKSGKMHPGTGKKGVRLPALKPGKSTYKQAVAIALSESGQSKNRSTRRSSRR